MPDTVPPEIIDLARHIACEHALDPALVCAVIEQESAWNPWAVRYEPDSFRATSLRSTPQENSAPPKPTRAPCRGD